MTGGSRDSQDRSHNEARTGGSRDAQGRGQSETWTGGSRDSQGRGQPETRTGGSRDSEGRGQPENSTEGAKETEFKTYREYKEAQSRGEGSRESGVHDSRKGAKRPRGGVQKSRGIAQKSWNGRSEDSGGFFWIPSEREAEIIRERERGHFRVGLTTKKLLQTQKSVL